MVKNKIPASKLAGIEKSSELTSRVAPLKVLQRTSDTHKVAFRLICVNALELGRDQLPSCTSQRPLRMGDRFSPRQGSANLAIDLECGNTDIVRCAHRRDKRAGQVERRRDDAQLRKVVMLGIFHQCQRFGEGIEWLETGHHVDFFPTNTA